MERKKSLLNLNSSHIYELTEFLTVLFEMRTEHFHQRKELSWTAELQSFPPNFHTSHTFSSVGKAIFLVTIAVLQRLDKKANRKVLTKQSCIRFFSGNEDTNLGLPP